MFVKLDRRLTLLLCCPLCKSDLLETDSEFECESCGLSFPLVPIQVGKDRIEKVYDFRLNHPSYCIPQSKALWREAQMSYERTGDNLGLRDSLQEYLDEIDSVKEIYTEEFHISGDVLDVGGHQGRLRHFLDENVTLYVSVDPHIEVFRGLGEQPNLLKAYPCLSEPCNFLCTHAEYLPFKSRSFDWVHMRSVVDHFEDPYRAFLEAYRVSKINGRLLVGLAILEKIKTATKGEQQVSANENLSAAKSIARSDAFSIRRPYLKWKEGGWGRLYQAALERMPSTLIPQSVLQKGKVETHDNHMYRFTHSQLMDLMERTGWRVAKQHWQKQPYYYCIYAMGETLPTKKHNGNLPM